MGNYFYLYLQIKQLEYVNTDCLKSRTYMDCQYIDLKKRFLLCKISYNNDVLDFNN